MSALHVADLEETQPGQDPLAFFPPLDPAAAAFTIDQVWPRQMAPTTPGQAVVPAPAWLSAFDRPARD